MVGQPGPKPSTWLSWVTRWRVTQPGELSAAVALTLRETQSMWEIKQARKCAYEIAGVVVNEQPRNEELPGTLGFNSLNIL